MTQNLSSASSKRKPKKALIYTIIFKVNKFRKYPPAGISVKVFIYRTRGHVQGESLKYSRTKKILKYSTRARTRGNAIRFQAVKTLPYSFLSFVRSTLPKMYLQSLVRARTHQVARSRKIFVTLRHRHNDIGHELASAR